MLWYELPFGRILYIHTIGSVSSVRKICLVEPVFVAAVLERDVRVRMILSERVYTVGNRKKFLFSLMDLNKVKNDTFVEVKVFHVSDFAGNLGPDPINQCKILLFAVIH